MERGVLVVGAGVHGERVATVAQSLEEVGVRVLVGVNPAASRYIRRSRDDSVPTTAIIAAAVPPMSMRAIGAEKMSASPPPPVEPSGMSPRSRL